MASGIPDASEVNAILLIFNNTDWANLGDASGLQNSASAGGWTCSGGTASNTAAVTFPTASSGSETETDFTIGLASGTGAGDVLFWGALTSSLAVSTNITPSFAIGALTASIG